jgi:hypothetical protein
MSPAALGAKRFLDTNDPKFNSRLIASAEALNPGG